MNAPAPNTYFIIVAWKHGMSNLYPVEVGQLENAEAFYKENEAATKISILKVLPDGSTETKKRWEKPYEPPVRIVRPEPLEPKADPIPPPDVTKDFYGAYRAELTFEVEYGEVVSSCMVSMIRDEECGCSLGWLEAHGGMENYRNGEFKKVSEKAINAILEWASENEW